MGKPYTGDDFRQLVLNIEATQLLSAAWASLKIIAKAGLFERHLGGQSAVLALGGGAD